MELIAENTCLDVIAKKPSLKYHFLEHKNGDGEKEYEYQEFFFPIHNIPPMEQIRVINVIVAPNLKEKGE